MSNFGLTFAMWLGVGGLGMALGLCGVGLASRRLRSQRPRALEHELPVRKATVDAAARKVSAAASPAPARILAADTLVGSTT